MNKLNCLIIEGEVVESYGNSITLAYERKPQDAIFVYHLQTFLAGFEPSLYTVQCNAEALGLKVGYQIRVVGRLQQDIINDEVVIVAEHIEILNKGIVKNIIPNE